MPGLTEKDVHEFWRDYDKRVLYRIVTSLEAVEDWVLDENENVQTALARLGDAIDSAQHFELTDENKLVSVIANLHSSKALRILQSLDSKFPGTASKLLMFAEEYSKKPEGKEAKLFLSRNLVFERLQLLSRIFAPERLSLVLNALEASDVE